MSKIFYIMGRSASGKDTIYRRLKNKYTQLNNIVTYTTRPMRENETNGVEYYFVDDNFVKEVQSSGKVIELREYNTVHGIWTYFTVDNIDRNKDYLGIGTLVSYNQLKEYFKNDNSVELIPIYIYVELGELLNRAITRERNQKEPKYNELCRRFLADTEDFNEENLMRAGINKYFNNDNLDICTNEIIEYISKNLGKEKV